jgi:TonB family protein
MRINSRLAVLASIAIFSPACLFGQQKHGSGNEPKAERYTLYKIRDGATAPKLISPPPTPPEWVKTELKVRITFVVLPDGSVANVKLLKRSKTEFDAFAVSEVNNWRFEPATKDGKPVAMQLETELNTHK